MRLLERHVPALILGASPRMTNLAARCLKVAPMGLDPAMTGSGRGRSIVRPVGIILLPMLALAACSPEPIEYIPPHDRTLLQAEARMGGAGGGTSAISVEQMLQRARTRPDSGVMASRLMLQFSGEAVALDEAQKQSLAQFANGAQGRPVTVLGRRANSASMLSQRRAVAVARVLSASLPAVDVKFSPDVPPDAIIVSLDAGQRSNTQ